MNLKNLVIKGFYIIFFILTSNTTIGANSSYILLKINNEIITNIDVEQEKKYLSAINEGLLSLSDKQIFEVAKASLIREKIKINELKKYYDLDIENRYINQLIKDFYTKLNFENLEELKKYFLSKGIELNDVKKKLNIEATWNELIFDKYNDKIDINEKKLKEKIKNDNFKNKNEKELILISEIIFSVINKSEIETIHKKILKSISDIGFDNTANIFSIAESAKFGGKIGWVETSRLSKLVYDNIKNLTIGAHSDLITVPGGFLILKVNDKKKEKIELDPAKELEQLIIYEKNKQFNQFSSIYFQRVKINTLINED